MTLQDDTRDAAPIGEAPQPDPELALDHGRAGTAQITIVAIGAAIILSVVFYGLTRPVEQPTLTASAGETGAAAPGAQPSQANAQQPASASAEKGAQPAGPPQNSQSGTQQPQNMPPAITGTGGAAPANAPQNGAKK